MWWALGVSVAGLVLSGGLALVFGFNRSKLAIQLGRARGEIQDLRSQLEDARRELEGLRVALARALERDPTLDDLERVSALAAGADARPDAAGAIRVP